MNYLENAFRKVKDDLLAKGIYDLLKYAFLSGIILSFSS